MALGDDVIAEHTQYHPRFAKPTPKVTAGKKKAKVAKGTKSTKGAGGAQAAYQKWLTRTKAADTQSTSRAPVARQTQVLPSMTTFLDFSDDRCELMHEHIHLHVVMMVSAAVNRIFQQRTSAVVTSHRAHLEASQTGSGDGIVFEQAPPKSFARAINKIHADYRYEARQPQL